MKIYLDMDGVLSDFEARYVKLFGERPNDVQRRHKEFYYYWDQFVQGENFLHLPMHSGAQQILNCVASLKDVQVEILSSSGGQNYHEEVARQKKAWLLNHGIPYKANIVPGGSKKAEYAGPWNILVDDTERVVQKYRQAGGTAILHFDPRITISKLHELHLEWCGGE